MIILVLGGTRSGKSAVAERLAANVGSNVTYLATAIVDPSDDDFVQRVHTHRARRPDTWNTIECGRDLVGHLKAASGPILIDSLGGWVAAHDDFETNTDSLIDALAARSGSTVLVSEEVGLGVHAASEPGRRFADSIGALNAKVALVADRVLLVVAGRVLELPREWEFDR